MTFDELEKQVLDLVKLIPVTATGLAESKERAGNFLVMQAVLINFKKTVDDDIASFGVLNDASYSNAIRSTDGKNITEKKIHVIENQEYAKSRISFEQLDSLRDWIKGHIKIFDHAHIFYRNLDRE